MADITARIERAGGRDRVQIIAVTKGFGADAVAAAVAAGVTMVGESYAQELGAKWPAVSELTVVPEIHFIGQLQSNKIRHLLDAVDVWQSVDRASVVEELARRAPGARVMIQLNPLDEPGKGGCATTDLDGLVGRCRDAGLAVNGLMVIGPTSQDPAMTAQAFRVTREAVDRLGLAACSMGMSDDLELAVEHGSTHVRIGTALFGARPLRGNSIG